MLAVMAVLAMVSSVQAGASAPQKKPKSETIVREILVPFSDLNVLLEGQPRRVLMSKEDYEDLLAKAEKTPEEKVPHAVLWSSADYRLDVGDQRGRIEGTLVLDVMKDGLHALPLDLGGVGLREAKLDDKAAPIGRGSDGRLRLFVQGKGRHTLSLKMVTPLTTTAATQVLQFRLPKTPAARIQMTVAGDVEVKSGLDVVSRKVDEAARVTRFELLPKGGDVALVMTLNSHLVRRQRVVVARSILIDEVTQAYEALHATVSLAILHQAVDQFQFTLPEGFEITEVHSPDLARWAIVKKGDDRILDVKLREATDKPVVLNIAAVRAPARRSGWKAPKLEPLDVVGHVAEVALFVEDRLKPESIAAKGLIPLDTAALVGALPESMTRGGDDRVPLRAVSAYYAPGGDFDLSADFVKPPAEVTLKSVYLLTLSDQGQKLHGGLGIRPEQEKLFSLDLAVPAGWQITQVTGPDDRPLDFERYGPEGKAGRIHIRLGQGLPPGKDTQIHFDATATPSGWLDDWKSRQVDFPAFQIVGDAHQTGAIAVETMDDLTVTAEKEEGLIPLDETQKKQFNLEGVDTKLAYRHESGTYNAKLTVRRTPPRLTARTFSFARVTPGELIGHAEIHYQVDEARTRTLRFALPESTPADVRLSAADGVRLKPHSAEVSDGLRHWTVPLAEARRGVIRLLVDFRQPLETEQAKDFAVPVVRAEGVAYQSGLVAFEGNAELDVRIETKARRVDVGELVDATYEPGRRLLGAYGFVGEPVTVTVKAFRHPAYAISPVVVQHAKLTTALSADGTAQTEVHFQLRTKAQFLEVQLPSKATLWSVWLDKTPVKPQEEGGHVLVSLPVAPDTTIRDLQIVYATPAASIGLTGQVAVAAPKLLLRDKKDSDPVEVPLVDLKWELKLPSRYEVVGSSGTVTTDDIHRPTPAVINVGRNVLPAALVGPWFLTAGESKKKSAVDKCASAPCYNFHEGAKKYESKDAKPDRGEKAADVGMAAPGVFSADLDIPFAAGPQMGTETRAVETPQALEPAWETKTKPSDKPRSGEDSKARLYSKITVHGGQDKATVEALMSQQNQPKAPPKVDAKKERREKYRPWSPQGHRSLKIQVGEQDLGQGGTVTFASFGVDPKLEVTLANRAGLNALGWGLALAVAVGGIALTCRRPWAKFRYIVGLGTAATVIPFLPGLLLLAVPCNMAFYAICLLLPYYFIVWVARAIVRYMIQYCPICRAMTAVGLIVLLACAPAALAGGSSPSDENPFARPPVVQDVSRLPKMPITVQVVPPPEPVRLPGEAIIIPYDPDSVTGIQDAEQRLVPYAKYVELWDRAYPDKKLSKKKPPSPYALAGANYTTRLEGDDFLLVEGRLEIDVYDDGYVSVPLGLDGGVLAKAELDGKPARLSVVQPRMHGNNPFDEPMPRQSVSKRRSMPEVRPLVVIHVSGKGRHQLALAVRLGLTRQGGWRLVEGTLPSAPAGALTLTVPDAQTEVRLRQVADRASYETKEPAEEIKTALPADGLLRVQWRPKVAEGEVDRSLTAQSDAVLDIQEDGLQVRWTTTLSFRRTRRDVFTLEAPAGYLVKKVEGDNVRGWEVAPGDKVQKVKVTLLEPAKDRQQLTLVMNRQGKPDTVDAPIVNVADAALHQGRLTIRRSPMLDLQTVKTSRVSRTDVPADLARIARDEAASPLGIRPFQAYQFTSTPFEIRLAASPVAADVRAELQSVIKVSDLQRTLETRIKLRVEDRPLYEVKILLPKQFKPDQVLAPGQFEWALTDPKPADPKGRRLLTVYLTQGQRGDVSVVLHGKLPKPAQADELVLPEITVLGVQRQEGDMAVQVDPAYRVEVAESTNLQAVLVRQLASWLGSQQRELTRLALHYRGDDYAGRLKLTRRQPNVSCVTISNVRVTDRAVEETISLDFTIREAGVRRIQFLLPSWMVGARVKSPMLRDKSIKPVGKDKDSPLQVTIELQDEVMGRLQVLVEKDRLLTPGAHQAPIPTVQTGQTARRYVTIESAGRDEVVVDPKQLAGLESISRQQREWKTLQAVFGDNITRAYLVQPGTENPRLVFHAKSRKAVETAGAWIGLAETQLMVDANGAYRGLVVYHLGNRTEQFLDIELPHNARLWAAQVAGEPVKPIKDPKAADKRHLCIPLVKTAEGDLDYEVRLVYGGKLPALGLVNTSVSFPLIRTLDKEITTEQGEKIRLQLQPEQSQVRLYLPKTQHWFDFSGTMRLVEDEGDLAAGKMAYTNKELAKIQQSVDSDNPFAQERAVYNYKQLQSKIQREQADVSRGNNDALDAEWTKNSAIMGKLEKQVKALEAAPEQSQHLGNRGLLNKRFAVQAPKRARNVVAEAGRNFVSPTPQLPSSPQTVQVFNDTQSMNQRWLRSNNLDNASTPAEAMQKAFAGVEIDENTPQLAVSSSRRQITVQLPEVSDVTSQSGQPGFSANQPYQPAPQVSLGKSVAKYPAKGMPAQDELGAESQPQSSVARYKQKLRQKGQAKRGSGMSVPGGGLAGPGSGEIVGYGGMPAVGMGGAMGDSFAQHDARTAKTTSAATRPSGAPVHMLVTPRIIVQEEEEKPLEDRAPTMQVPEPAGAMPTAPAGLASLLVELPKPDEDYYCTYFFTTPRGRIEIVGRAASGDMLDGLGRLVAVVVVVGLLVLLVRLDWSPIGRWLASPTGSNVLIILGLVGLCIFTLPALVALITGATLHLRRRLHRTAGTV
ncbi:MAG: hypothetical protein JW818_17080 [Pirellulales bacterium]|nr:hypothetical protein [Pirellulales bacterium]